MAATLKGQSILLAALASSTCVTLLAMSGSGKTIANFPTIPETSKVQSSDRDDEAVIRDQSKPRTSKPVSSARVPLSSPAAPLQDAESVDSLLEARQVYPDAVFCEDCYIRDSNLDPGLVGENFFVSASEIYPHVSFQGDSSESPSAEVEQRAPIDWQAVPPYDSVTYQSEGGFTNADEEGVDLENVDSIVAAESHLDDALQAFPDDPNASPPYAGIKYER